ncbi:MAG TPA: 6-phosphogluconolactonase [Candidatus Saccharimonadales bacterium]|nr:6-phosphogluconolactonase [Candidatus Saccharimonadales bacterium]
MKITRVSSLGESVGLLWKKLQKKYTEHGHFLVASPLSSTPLPIYRWLLENAQSIPHWEKLKFVFMDEQVKEVDGKLAYLSIENPASFEHFARKHFLHPLSEKVSISEEQMILKPDLEKLQDFDMLLNNHNGLDLLVLAIGEEGHYALVMPGTSIEKGYHMVNISPKVITQHVDSNGPYKGTAFSASGMSLGPLQVMQAKHIVIIISGERKRKLAKELLAADHFSPDFPLSIIYHPDIQDRVEIFLTEDVF